MISTRLCERASSVTLPMNLVALEVATTCTLWPASVNNRISDADLYAAIPPVTPTITLANWLDRLV